MSTMYWFHVYFYHIIRFLQLAQARMQIASLESSASASSSSSSNNGLAVGLSSGGGLGAIMGGVGGSSLNSLSTDPSIFGQLNPSMAMYGAGGMAGLGGLGSLGGMGAYGYPGGFAPYPSVILQPQTASIFGTALPPSLPTSTVLPTPLLPSITSATDFAAFMASLNEPQSFTAKPANPGLGLNAIGTLGQAGVAMPPFGYASMYGGTQVRTLSDIYIEHVIVISFMGLLL